MPKLIRFYYRGLCLDCGDVWEEDQVPVVCPECESLRGPRYHPRTEARMMFDPPDLGAPGPQPPETRRPLTFDPYQRLERGYSRADRRQLATDVFILFAVSLVLIISFLVALP